MAPTRASRPSPTGIPPRASRLRPPATVSETVEESTIPDASGPIHRLAPRPRLGRLQALLSLSGGMVLALLWLCWLGPAVSSWWHEQQNQYTYGTARVSELDLQDHGRLHLLAQDWHGTILVIAVTAPASGSGQAPPGIHLCTFPHVLSEPAGSPPRVVTLQVQSPPGQASPVILVQVEGVPFRLVCHLSTAAGPSGSTAALPLSPRRTRHA
ncbi:hypothetical protein [Thermogemmatispora tikiterensis]|uniref:Uncharacterized protein n=1 Tax=Thermogemmatispora tikiterensis TaxID=1825093 RepID=A0A328VNE5_9CHLR|nr:hypothetical protein [Thermogemmatispora tikiterensis]RAQ98371.1 hypothetical protein A4R35_22715 [Thermogemmatispora tikiterensis]